ncbi:hypothetical protein LINPERHAP2_LOCUS7577 [Linum perenne]
METLFQTRRDLPLHPSCLGLPPRHTV